MTHFSVTHDATFAFVVVLLAINVLPIVSVETMKCYGDICNRGAEDQFCSVYYAMCRNCADVVMDCGTKNQPLECTRYCVSFKVALELQRERNTTCALYNTITNGFVLPHPNASRPVTINTTVTFSCKEGFTLDGMRTKTCLGNDIWTEENDPICLRNTYILWQRSGMPLVALSTTLFIVIVILMVLHLRKPCQQRMNAQQSVSLTPQTMRCSSDESGIDSIEQGESCALINDETSTHSLQRCTEKKAEKATEFPTCEEAESSGQSAKDVPSEPSIDSISDSSQCMNSNSVVNNINVSVNQINERGSNAQHHTTHTNNREENITNKRDGKSEEEQSKGEHSTDKTPIKESQETVEALQETQKGLPSKGTIPLLQNENNFALNEPTALCCNDRAFVATGSRAKQPHCPIN